MNLTPILTAAGLNAVINATNDGLQARIVNIALGDSAWSPDHSATALVNERTRVPITGSTRVNASQIHVTAIENGEVDYWVREIGFYLEDDTLLAIWSQPDVSRPLAYKATGVDLLLGFDLVLSALPVDSVVIEDAGGLNLGPATIEMAGVVRLATEDEVIEGTRNDVALTPASAQALVQPATQDNAGVIRIATNEEALAGVSDDIAMTPHSLDEVLVEKVNTLLPDATTETPGIARFATDQEALDRDLNNRMVTPAQLMQVRDTVTPQRIEFGAVQLTGWLNNWDALVDYTTPPGTVMVGLYSVHRNDKEDRRFRVRYQSLSLVSDLPSQSIQ